MVSSEQKRFFVRNGFLQIQGAVPASVCDRLIEETWTHLPSGWSRNDPSTWIGDVPDSCQTANLRYRRGLLKFQDKSLYQRADVIEAFGPGSSVFECAVDLIGRELTSIRVRGLYANVPPPSPDSLPSTTKPHVEAHPVQIVALAYLSDVSDHGGGLLVWPGTHRVLYNAFDSKMDFVSTTRYHDLFTHHCRLAPVELMGRRGDVIFTHHRLFHAPSLNLSDKIRFALLCDYTPKDYRVLCTQVPGELWEDWPGLAEEAQEAGDAPDYRLAFVSTNDAIGPLPANASTHRKRDASLLARSRHPGDIWVIVSDEARDDADSRLDPRGSDLTSAGTRVLINNEEIASKSRHDIIARVHLSDGRNEFRIKNVSQDVWLRLVKVGLPLSESYVFFSTKLAGPEQEWIVTIGPREEKSEGRLQFTCERRRGIRDFACASS